MGVADLPDAVNAVIRCHFKGVRKPDASDRSALANLKAVKAQRRDNIAAVNEYLGLAFKTMEVLQHCPVKRAKDFIHAAVSTAFRIAGADIPCGIVTQYPG